MLLEDSRSAVSEGQTFLRDVIRTAHEAGLKQLQQLEEAASAIGQDGAFQEALWFFHNEMEDHFRGEEQALFPAMARHVGWAGIVRAMLEEHQSLGKAVDALEEALQPPQESSRARQVALHIVWLLRSHIQKEEAALVPLAERTLSSAEMEKVALEMAAQQRKET